MIYETYTVYDKAVGAFLQPFFCRSRGEALRSFTASVNDAEHQFHKYAADYVMFQLGAYDDGGGRFAECEPTRVISALEVLVPEASVIEASPLNGSRSLPRGTRV